MIDAVRGASTPEALAAVLEEIGRRYVVARKEEHKFAEVKSEIRDACVAALKKLETDAYEWVVDGKKFRAKTYQIVKVRPTQALADVLRNRGLGHLVQVRFEVDDEALFSEIRRGTVGIEEVRTLSEISRSEGFRISELKEKETGEEREAVE